MPKRRKKTDNSGKTPPFSIVYYNGDILTMECENANYAEAVVVRDAKITFTGSKDEAMKQAGEGHNRVDLEGKTMTPGFVEPHVHPSIAASILPNELLLHMTGHCQKNQKRRCRARPLHQSAHSIDSKKC
ncbi:hypothetical protein [Flavobacterium humidisoli]|uniref:Amidohydrolase 3 domain-containing protein n=1 Tax=Flavobacterium humidisoli TaxID=2937442 RepID=A0ABY4LYE9_9FLAO|nr:hypothetical protein [Flavobacterium humidisoli]UPZ17842.1 hypothetical protein M0M44_10945 [Flavobacterium humidisoli]